LHNTTDLIQKYSIMLSKLNSMQNIIVGAVFVFASLTAFAALSVPTYATSNARISAILECVISRDLDGDSVVDLYTAVWGYNSLNTVVVSVTAGGTDNQYVPSPAFRGQPTDFNPGRAYAAFANNFTSGNVVWQLKGPDGNRRTATANPSSKACSASVVAANPYDPALTY
jgi:hypothetical protein